MPPEPEFATNVIAVVSFGHGSPSDDAFAAANRVLATLRLDG